MFCPKCGTQNPDNGKFCRTCGTDLGNISDALSGVSAAPPEFYTDRKGRRILSDPKVYTDKKGRRILSDPSDVFSRGIKELVVGLGFLVATYALYTTNIWGGRNWWWALLFPAFGSLAKGISELARYQMIKEKNDPVKQPANSLNQSPAGANLPPAQTEYIRPQSSIYDTGDLVAPPSVTEETTRHLQIDQDGETMTLPKQ